MGVLCYLLKRVEVFEASKMFVKAVVILLTCSILPIAYAAPTIEDSETCVKLEDCPHLLLLWSNRGKPGFPPTQNVTEVMREKQLRFRKLISKSPLPTGRRSFGG